MSIGSKMKTIGENLLTVYDSAFSKGESHGQAACQAVHYTTSVIGSGTRRMEFPIPFEPDIFAFFCVSADAVDTPYGYRGLIVDFRSVSRYAGHMMATNANGASGSLSLAPSDVPTFVRYENGVMIYEIEGDRHQSQHFPATARYAVVAIRYPGEDGETLLREQIALLPDVVPQNSSGTLTYTREAVERYMTAEEWENLIATKPNWTFVMT